MQLENTVALVTGGASGLGKGIAIVLAQRGAKVALADLNLAGAQASASEISSQGGSAKAYRVDVTRRAELNALVSQVVSDFGKIDALVNGAGVIGAPGWEDSPTAREEDWDITFDVNVKGTVLASEAVAEHMKTRREGRIVNIASHAARMGGKGGGAYGASKAAVVHLTQSFALDLAEYNINVNVVCPGTIWTPMWERISERRRHLDPSAASKTTREIFEEAIRERCPLGREQTPEDIGKAVAFFASDDAYNITGQSLNVNGGTRMN
jgi:meso-butanediol dehydrogenase/(S,S)-butanediol dehydrogenase/diacetyl reductase